MQTLLIQSYLAGTAPSWLLAFAIGRKKGISGIKLLFGAVMLALSWPLWATGALALSVIGLCLAVVGTLALTFFVAFCVVGFLWITLLLKCIEILGWLNEKKAKALP